MKTQILGFTALALIFYSQLTYAQNGQTASTNQIPDSRTLKGFMSHTMIVSPDQSTIVKLKVVYLRMKPIRSVQSTNLGPKTIEDAGDFLSKHLSMACPPSVCAEYDGVFYFSGGTSTNQDTNYSSGFAIKKGETIIHSWNKEDKKQPSGLASIWWTSVG